MNVRAAAKATRAAAAGALLAVLAGCIVLPQTREVYDPECRVLTRHVTLEAAVLGGFQNCAGHGCAAMLASMGVVSAASAVVSGSIALVGNVVYWFERQGRCNPVPPPELPSGALR